MCAYEALYDDEWKKLPHALWTSDTNWDPSIIDNHISDTNEWMKNLPDGEGKYLDNPFNLCGDYIYGESGWQTEDRLNAINAMVYDTTDLNAQGSI